MLENFLKNIPRKYRVNKNFSNDAYYQALNDAIYAALQYGNLFFSVKNEMNEIQKKSSLCQFLWKSLYKRGQT
jgi:hypothetical protein